MDIILPKIPKIPPLEPIITSSAKQQWVKLEKKRVAK